MPPRSRARPQGQGRAQRRVWRFGTLSEPMVGQRIGGVDVLGGGLGLYKGDVEIGAVGVSGDILVYRSHGCLAHAPRARARPVRIRGRRSGGSIRRGYQPPRQHHLRHSTQSGRYRRHRPVAHRDRRGRPKRRHRLRPSEMRQQSPTSGPPSRPPRACPRCNSRQHVASAMGRSAASLPSSGDTATRSGSRCLGRPTLLVWGLSQLRRRGADG